MPPPSSPSLTSSSKIQTTSSYFHQVRHQAYHQKAGRDRGTHAYTIGQEMTVSRSMVKPPLINVGTMKANLSLKGILNRWHLNCLCWDRSQKSATAGNMTGGGWFYTCVVFWAGVNNTICREIFIHWQKGNFMPLVTEFSLHLLLFFFYQHFP